jgi:hypothetical protein
MDVLGETNSVISGSTALLIFFPHLFTPGDINFYVPTGQGDDFMAKINMISDYQHVVKLSNL